MKITKGQAAAAIILATIILDQFIKIWVKTHFYLGEELRIAEWFRLVFVENDGMAFGMQMGSKLFLTLFQNRGCDSVVLGNSAFLSQD